MITSALTEVGSSSPFIFSSTVAWQYGVKHGSRVACSSSAGSSCADKEDVRRYRPLDVRSWGDGTKVVIGWLLVPLIAVITGGLLALYELKYINITDRDLRDMHFDQRIMNQANNYYHKFFINSLICCNTDAVVYGAAQPVTCGFSEDRLPFDVPGERTLIYSNKAPYCPPKVVMQCPESLVSTACNATRVALYRAAGVDPFSGEYAACARAGRITVGSEVVSADRPVLLAAFYRAQLVDQLPVNDAFAINQTEVDMWVESLVAQYSDPEYRGPSVHPTRAFSLGSAPVALEAQQPIRTRGGLKSISPWPTAIFDWPGMSKRCPNTSIFPQWWMAGRVRVALPPFDYDNPAAMAAALEFQGDTAQVGYWKVERAPVGDEVGNDTGVVVVSQLAAVSVEVGMASVGGGCGAWLIDAANPFTFNITYRKVYSGPLSGANATVPELAGGAQDVEFAVFDVAGPDRISLPFYGGMWYIVFCFGMAAVWMFSLGPFIVFGIPLIWWNVRSNKGLPPIVYRYMQKYRGW